MQKLYALPRDVPLMGLAPLRELMKKKFQLSLRDLQIACLDNAMASLR
jgi:hypothetical protein